MISNKQFMSRFISLLESEEEFALDVLERLSWYKDQREKEQSNLELTRTLETYENTSFIYQDDDGDRYIVMDGWYCLISDLGETEFLEYPWQEVFVRSPFKGEWKKEGKNHVYKYRQEHSSSELLAIVITETKSSYHGYVIHPDLMKEQKSSIGINSRQFLCSKGEVGTTIFTYGGFTKNLEGLKERLLVKAHKHGVLEKWR